MAISGRRILHKSVKRRAAAKLVQALLGYKIPVVTGPQITESTLHLRAIRPIAGFLKISGTRPRIRDMIEPCPEGCEMLTRLIEIVVVVLAIYISVRLFRKRG